jgi:hypothetical protein
MGWVRSHRDIVKAWDTLGLSRDFLTPDARRCIDSANDLYGKSIEGETGHTCNVVEKTIAFGRTVDSIGVRRCAQVGEEEVQANRMERRQRDLEEHLPRAIEKWLGAVLGYRLAFVENSREEATAWIAKQKKSPRYAGVMSKLVIRKFQQQIRSADEAIEYLKRRAKANQVKILARSDERLRYIHACVDSSYDHELSDTVTESDINAIVGSTTSFAVEGQDCLWILIFMRETNPG